MNRLISHLALRLALRVAEDELAHLWRLGYVAGHRDARRSTIRAILPQASDRQIDRILALPQTVDR